MAASIIKKSLTYGFPPGMLPKPGVLIDGCSNPTYNCKRY